MSRGIYAKNTAVSVDRSKAEIEHTLERYGASAFMSGQSKEENAAWLMFKIEAAIVKIVIRCIRSFDRMRIETKRARCLNCYCRECRDEVC